FRAVVNDLQEYRPARFGNARKSSDDIVVDELAEFLGSDSSIDIWIEDFEKMAEAFAFRFFAKFLVTGERVAVLIEVVDERNGVKAEVRARKISVIAIAFDFSALNVVDARAAERLRRFTRVTSMPHCPNISRVIGTGRGSQVGIAKEALFNRKLLIHVSGHQHDVDQALMDDLADDVEKLRKIPVTEFVARPDF